MRSESHRSSHHGQENDNSHRSDRHSGSYQSERHGRSHRSEGHGNGHHSDGHGSCRDVEYPHRRSQKRDRSDSSWYTVRSRRNSRDSRSRSNTRYSQEPSASGPRGRGSHHDRYPKVQYSQPGYDSDPSPSPPPRIPSPEERPYTGKGKQNQNQHRKGQRGGQQA